MYRYFSFGLGIHATFPLPELPARNGPADVLVRRSKIERQPPEHVTDGPFVEISGEEVYLFWKEVGGVLVRGGREIVVDPLPDAEAPVLRHIIQGVATGILLHQRGIFTLHASAVAIGGHVAAFIGWKGWGKSTTTAALYARGHHLVTDDVLALALPPHGDVHVLPGVPQLKLWPEAAAASLGEDPENLPRLYTPSSKRVRSLKEGFQLTSLPLRCIYVLDFAPEEQADPSVEPLPHRDAFTQLITHSYALRFLGNEGATPGHLMQCTRVVQQVPLRRLRRPRSLARLSSLAACVEEDIARMAAAAVGEPTPPNPALRRRGDHPAALDRPPSVYAS